MPTQGNPKFTVRLPEKKRLRFVAMAYNAGTNAAQVTQELIDWWMGEPGAELPNRPIADAPPAPLAALFTASPTDLDAARVSEWTPSSEPITVVPQGSDSLALVSHFAALNDEGEIIASGRVPNGPLSLQRGDTLTLGRFRLA